MIPSDSASARKALASAPPRPLATDKQAIVRANSKGTGATVNRDISSHLCNYSAMERGRGSALDSTGVRGNPSRAEAVSVTPSLLKKGVLGFRARAFPLKTRFYDRLS